ncbi:MAG: hypothetical protein M1840_003801 [Geoglossum simile]|nr:MAG: hypothetical protein M1840_003801 [Geoglossum simile]
MTPEKLSKEVSECSALLRQLYALELEIWAQKGVVAAEIPKREESQRRANALFAEIRRKINNLKSMPSAQWSPQERKIIEEICNVVNRQGEKRY